MRNADSLPSLGFSCPGRGEPLGTVAGAGGVPDSDSARRRRTRAGRSRWRREQVRAPLGDLALTLIHVRQHAPDLVDELLAAYGIDDPHERTRLDVYEALHLVDEWSWITTDQPHGWQRSVADLDQRLLALISAP